MVTNFERELMFDLPFDQAASFSGLPAQKNERGCKKVPTDPLRRAGAPRHCPMWLATCKGMGMTPAPPAERWRRLARLALAALYLTAAAFHLAKPGPFLGIMPGWVPWPDQVVFWTGVAEAAGALALLQPWSAPLRRAGGIGLALYAAGVYPANVNHMLIDLGKADGGLGLAYHVPRLLAQPLLVWLGLWSGGVIDWPWRRPKRHQR